VDGKVGNVQNFILSNISRSLQQVGECGNLVFECLSYGS
jgi:hypothetical protein